MVPVEAELILCEYPRFQNFDDEVFGWCQNVIVVGVTSMSLSVVQVSIKPQPKETPVTPHKQNVSYFTAKSVHVCLDHGLPLEGVIML